MDKTTTLLGALNAGKLPTTQQFDAFVEWVEKDVGLFAAETVNNAAAGVEEIRREEEPGPKGEGKSNLSLIAKDVRDLLGAYREFLNDKNADNILQEAIWHLRVVSHPAAAATTTTVGATKEKEDLAKDLYKTRLAILKLLSCLWESSTSEIRSIGVGVGGGGEGKPPLFEDLVSLLCSTLADVAEVVEEKAGEVKEELRKGPTAAKEGSGPMDTEEGDTTKAKWESGVERAKKVGSGVIDTKRDVEGKVKDVKEGGEERVREGLVSIWERAQRDPEYKQALDTLFEVLQKRLRRTLGAVSDPDLSSFVHFDDSDQDEKSTEERQHILEALHLLRVLFERSAGGTSLDPLIQKTKAAGTKILGDKSLKQWFDDFLTYCRAVLADVGCARSSEARKEREELRERWQALMEKDEWKKVVEDVKEEVSRVERGLKGDDGLKSVGEAQGRLERDLREVVGEEMMWCWTDFVRIYLPRVLRKMKSLPIPRTEYKDEDIEFVLENLDISGLDIFPSHVHIRNITDVDISTETEAETKTRLGAVTHIQIQAVQFELRDVSFWYKNLKSSIGPNEFTGLLGMKLPPQGIDVDLQVRLIPENVTGKHSRESMRAYLIIERADVHLADDVEIKVKESNHPLLVKVFQPIVKRHVKEALERTLSGQVRALVEFVDGGIWDVGERKKVFKDVGLGEGAASVAAIWSEIGKLERGVEGGVKLGARATGTGVVFEAKVPGVPKERVLAVGVEPQVLGGEKRGPLGTGSERIGKPDVEGFKQAVARKEQLEKNKNGWQTNAFDF